MGDEKLRRAVEQWVDEIDILREFHDCPLRDLIGEGETGLPGIYKAFKEMIYKFPAKSNNASELGNYYLESTLKK